MIDVAVVVGRCVPALGHDRDSALQTRGDLNDRRRRLDGIESEFAADDEAEILLAGKVLMTRRHLV